MGINGKNINGMDILVYTCCYKRPEAFRLFCANMQLLQLVCKAEIEVLIIGDKDNERIALDHGLEFVPYPGPEDKQLGMKWNVGLSICKEIDFDYLFISGSDDLYSPALFDKYFDEVMNQGWHYMGILDFYFYHLRLGHLKYFPGHKYDRQGEPNGAGRMIHRSVLEALEWELWGDDQQSGLDLTATRRLETVENLTKRFLKLNDYGLVALDIKDGQNIHSIDVYKGNYIRDPEHIERVLRAVGITTKV